MPQAKRTADKIAERMTNEGHKVASLHGSKEATDRDSVMDRFRDGQDKVLITTNVIARGIDIPQVNMVVNYDLPMMSERQQEPGVNDRLDLVPDVETYIHRIGMEPSRVDSPNEFYSNNSQVVRAALGGRVSRSTSCITRNRSRT